MEAPSVFSGSYRSRRSDIHVSRARLLLLLLLSRLCSNAPCGMGAAVIIGSMAVREKERERREGLEYRTADSYLVARRCAACQLQATPMGEGICV